MNVKIKILDFSQQLEHCAISEESVDFYVGMTRTSSYDPGHRLIRHPSQSVMLPCSWRVKSFTTLSLNWFFGVAEDCCMFSTLPCGAFLRGRQVKSL